MVDTNVLLAATDVSRTVHGAAVAVLERDPRRLALCPQIVREYLVVATRPRGVNGLGLPVAAAVSNVEQFLDDMDLVGEDAATARELRQWAIRYDVSGTQINDANLVAVALSRGASVIVTDNARHVARFAEVIGIESLSPSP